MNYQPQFIPVMISVHADANVDANICHVALGTTGQTLCTCFPRHAPAPKGSEDCYRSNKALDR